MGIYRNGPRNEYLIKCKVRFDNFVVILLISIGLYEYKFLKDFFFCNAVMSNNMEYGITNKFYRDYME